MALYKSVYYYYYYYYYYYQLSPQKENKTATCHNLDDKDVGYRQCADILHLKK